LFVWVIIFKPNCINLVITFCMISSTASTHHFKNLLKKTGLLIIFIASSLIVYAQNGTYQKKGPKGAYCLISFQNNGGHVNAEVFAWWNTPSSQMGDYSGEGTLKGNTVLLKSDLNDPDCKVMLSVVQGKIKASFSKCSTDHLTEDFNGIYSKITDAVAGDYTVTVAKAYFYKSPDASSKLKAYVLKGDKVTLDMDRIGASKQNWVNVYFTSKAGKETAGYLPLSQLKLINKKS
jgi:hypothetical protein